MRITEKDGYENHGDYPIWLRGSRETIHRVVYQNCETRKCYIVFYGKLVEVEHLSVGYGTVEDY